MTNKQALRREIRARYEGKAARDLESALLSRRILQSDLYKSARAVGGYMPLPREADITPVLEEHLRAGRTLALPLCSEPPMMTLRRVDSLAELTVGTYGILEPRANAPIIPVEELDLLLVPLEGIDRTGMRLGKGGGYYDRLLADADIPAMGCALSWQWTDRVPRDAWDRPLTACADCQGIHSFTHYDRKEGTD